MDKSLMKIGIALFFALGLMISCEQNDVLPEEFDKQWSCNKIWYNNQDVCVPSIPNPL